MAITDRRDKNGPSPLDESEAPTVTSVTGWTEGQTGARSSTLARVASADTAERGVLQRPALFAPPIGTLVDGRYQVRGKLGTGGFANVLRVADTFEGSVERAMKVVAQEGYAYTTMQEEFQVLAGLRHPNLASVHEFGHLDGGAVYFTQDLVDGVALHRSGMAVHDPAFPAVVAQICRALEYTHTRGVQHRDVKPSNILVTLEQEPVVHLLDFGLAGPVTGEMIRERLVGTISYVSPETILGRDTDARSDLYSLGVTLFRMATGHAPFQGTQREVLDGHLRLPVPSLPAFGVPAWLVEIVPRLMDKSPSLRPASANEVIRLMQRATGQELPLETTLTVEGYVLSGEFVGQRPILRTLRHALRAASVAGGIDAPGEPDSDAAAPEEPATRPHAVLVVGAGGEGKSRLVREFAQRIQLEGGRVIAGTAYRAAGSPMRPLAALASQAVAVTPREALSPDLRRTLSALVPELREPGDDRIEADIDPRRARSTLADGLLNLLRATFERSRGLVVLGDLHYASEDVVEVFALLAARLQSATQPPPVLLLGTTRTGAAAERLGTEGCIDTLALAPLTQSDVRRLVRSMFGRRDLLGATVLDRIHRLSGGNPFLVEETLKVAAAEGALVYRKGRWKFDASAEQSLPRTVGELVRRRVHKLGPAARELVATLAVLGRPSSQALISDAALEPVSDPYPILRDLTERRLLRSVRVDGDLAFELAHDHLEEAAYSALVAPDRAPQRHHRAAASIVKRPLPDEADQHADLARHHEAAGDLEAAAHSYLLAAESGWRAFAAGAALGHAQRALETSDARSASAISALRLLCGIHNAVGNREAEAAAIAKFEQTAAVHGSRARAEAAYCRARHARLVGDTAGLFAAAERVFALAGDADPDIRADTQIVLGSHYLHAMEMDKGRECFEDAVAIHRRSGDQRALAKALAYRADAESMDSRPREAELFIAQALDIVATLRDASTENRLLHSLAISRRQRGDWDGAREATLKGIALARAEGDATREGAELNNLCSIELCRNDVQAGFEAAQTALAVKRRAGVRTGVGITLFNLGVCHAFVADWPGADAAWNEVLTLDVPEAVGVAITGMRGDVALVQADFAGAIDRYRAAIRRGKELGVPELTEDPQANLVRALIARGDPADLEEAEAIASARLDASGSDRHRHFIIKSLLSKSLIAELHGDESQALSEASEAVRVLDELGTIEGMVGSTEEVRYQAARLLWRKGDRGDAVRRFTATAESLAARAALIADPVWRRGFLRLFSVNHQLLEKPEVGLAATVQVFLPRPHML